LRPATAILVAFAALVLALRSAQAQTRAPLQTQTPSSIIVLESYEVRRPERADAPMGILRQELDKLGYIASPPDVKGRLGVQLALRASEPPDPPAMGSTRLKGRSSDQKNRLPRPRASAAALYKELSDVHERWLAAKESFETLEPALLSAALDALASPALVVGDPSIRDKLQSVILDLALINGKLAHARSGNEDDPKGERATDRARAAKEYQKAAESWMAEWIRTYEGAEITQKKHGPDADELFTRVRDEHNKLGRGSLAITVDDPNVQLYVNETIRSLHHPIPRLYAGRYRALLMGPNDDARVFSPEVIPNQTTRLDVDWSISSNLEVGEWFVAFVFASTTHPDPAALACKLARKVGLRGVILIGMDTIEKQSRASASLYGAKSCQIVRGGYTVLGTGPTQRKLAALALFIAQGTPDADVVAATENLTTLNELREPEPEGSAARAPMPSEMSRDSGPHRIRNWSAAGGAAAALALGVYGLYRYYPCGEAASAHCRYYYRYSGIVGYGATGAGIALGALAGYWFYRDSKAQSGSTVTVVPSHSGAMVSWGAEF
jgi:hypothetical protein